MTDTPSTKRAEPTAATPSSGVPALEGGRPADGAVILPFAARPRRARRTPGTEPASSPDRPRRRGDRCGRCVTCGLECPRCAGATPPTGSPTSPGRSPVPPERPRLELADTDLVDEIWPAVFPAEQEPEWPPEPW